MLSVTLFGCDFQHAYLQLWSKSNTRKIKNSSHRFFMKLKSLGRLEGASCPAMDAVKCKSCDTGICPCPLSGGVFAYSLQENEGHIGIYKESFRWWATPLFFKKDTVAGLLRPVLSLGRVWVCIDWKLKALFLPCNWESCVSYSSRLNFPCNWESRVSYSSSRKKGPKGCLAYKWL